MPVTINTDNELVAALKGEVRPQNGIFNLAPITFTLPKDLVVPRKALEFVYFQAANPNNPATIKCPGVLYLTTASDVGFENITFQGAINSRNCRNITFRNCTLEDPEAIGWRQLVLFKSTGAPNPYNPNAANRDVGAGPIKFLNCVFEQNPQSEDCMLDFVATQGVVMDSCVVKHCERGVFQCKGGSGCLVPFQISNNWIWEAGQRGIYLGGGTNPEFFDPPIDVAQAEFGAAEVYNNVILGGGCAFTVGTAKGPIDFHHNLCVGQEGHQFRLVHENMNPACREGIRNVTIRNSTMCDWIPPKWPNTNVLAVSAKGVVRWDTISLYDLVFNYLNRSQFWGWPDEHPIPVQGVVNDVPVTLLYSGIGYVNGIEGWDNYKPRTTTTYPPWDVKPPTEPEPEPEPSPTMAFFYLDLETMEVEQDEPKRPSLYITIEKVNMNPWTD